MISTTYLSSATDYGRPRRFEELLEHCRTNNAGAGITGVLLYWGATSSKPSKGRSRPWTS